MSKAGRKAGDEFGDGMEKGAKGGRMRNVGAAMGGALKLGLLGAAAGAGIAVGKAFTDGIRGASNLEQSIGGIGAVFGKDVEQIDRAAREAATSMGLSRNAYNELATTVGAGLKNKGIKDYAGETQKLLGLGGDLAAQFGGSTQEAVEALSSLMRGEADPIERYGVSINETAVNAELAARGQDKLTGAALESAKAQARLDLVFRQTADAQGAFARESNTFAGVQARASAQWEDLQAKIGTVFLPVLTKAMGFISNTAIPALDAFGGWISRARDALSQPGDGGGWMSTVASTFSDIAATARDVLGPVIDTIVTKFRELSPQINAAMTQLGQIVRGAMELISTVVGVALDAIRKLWAMWGDNILALIRIVMDTLMGIIRGVMTVIQGVINVIMGIITGDWSRAWQGIRQIFDGIWQIILSILRGAVQALWQVILAGFDIVRGIFRNVADFLTGLWRGLWDGLLFVGRSIMASISGAIDAGLMAIRGFFQSGVDTIRTIWDGLRAAASAPVRFVIDTVINNGIIKGWNDLLGLLQLPDSGLTKRLAPISVPGFAHGGVLPGPGTSRGDDMVVMDRSGRVRATVASGEPVISRAGYARNKAVVDHIIRGGQVPGFFMGGTLPAAGPQNRHSGYAFTRGAWDIPAGMGAPVRAWKAGQVAYTNRWGYSYGNHIMLNHGGGEQSLYAHLSRIMVSAGQAIAAGQQIGAVGSTGNSTGPHLHFEIRGGNSPIGASASGSAEGESSGLFDMAGQWITDKLASPVRAMLDRVPGAGVFMGAVKGMGTKMLDLAVEKIKSLIPFGSDSDSMSGSAAGASWQGNANLLMQAGRALGASPRAMLIALATAAQESSMGTNRRAMYSINGDGDVGWFQQRATRGDGTVAQLADPLYALRTFLYGKRVPAGYHVPGLYNIRGWEGMPVTTAAQRVQVSAYPYAYAKWEDDARRWMAAFGYAGGTRNATAGWHLVGERGPELINLRGGEQVADSPTSKEVLGSMGKAKEINIVVQNHDPAGAAARMMDELRWVRA